MHMHIQTHIDIKIQITLTFTPLWNTPITLRKSHKLPLFFPHSKPSPIIPTYPKEPKLPPHRFWWRRLSGPESLGQDPPPSPSNLEVHWNVQEQHPRQSHTGLLYDPGYCHLRIPVWVGNCNVWVIYTMHNEQTML